jgi:hypothetical protein
MLRPMQPLVVFWHVQHVSDNWEASRTRWQWRSPSNLISNNIPGEEGYHACQPQDQRARKVEYRHRDGLFGRHSGRQVMSICRVEQVPVLRRTEPKLGGSTTYPCRNISVLRKTRITPSDCITRRPRDWYHMKPTFDLLGFRWRKNLPPTIFFR